MNENTNPRCHEKTSFCELVTSSFTESHHSGVKPPEVCNLTDFTRKSQGYYTIAWQLKKKLPQEDIEFIVQCAILIVHITC